MPMHAVAHKYRTSRGFVQTLAQTCEGFAAGTIQFCDRMGWGMLKSVLEHMSDRLQAGARADLLDLAKIPFVKSRTARVLWDNGFRSLMAVAEADPKDLVPTLLLVRTHRSLFATRCSDDRLNRARFDHSGETRSSSGRRLRLRLRLSSTRPAVCGVCIWNPCNWRRVNPGNTLGLRQQVDIEEDM